MKHLINREKRKKKQNQQNYNKNNKKETLSVSFFNCVFPILLEVQIQSSHHCSYFH